MTAEGEDITANMKEIKVRLWGTDIGIGISRCTAIVHSSFMPQKLLSNPVQPSASVSSIGNRESGSSQGNTVNSKRGISPAAASKRKRKALTSMDLDEVQEDHLELNRPIYDSETGEGTRPTVSYLAPQSSLFDYVFVSSSPPSNDGLLVQTVITSDSKTPVPTVEPPVSNSTKLKPRSAVSNTINKFWKLIDEENYFQPFSKKAGRIDELCLRGGDYDNLLMTPSISRSQSAFMNNGDCILAPPLKSFDNEDPTPVLPFLGSLEGQKSFPASDITSDKVLFVNSVPHELNKSDASDPITATSSSFSNECSGIDFLYQRLVASFVLMSEQKDDLSMSGSLSTNGTGDSKTFHHTFAPYGEHKHDYNAQQTELEFRNGSKLLDFTAEITNGVAKSVYDNYQHDQIPVSILEFTHGVSCEAPVSACVEDTGRHIVNGNGTDHRSDAKPENMEIEIEIEVEVDVEGTLQKNLVNKFNGDNYLISSNACPLLLCVQCDGADSKQCALSRDQRTIIELAEIGLLHPFDCPPAEIKKVEIKMEIDVEVTDCYTDCVRTDNTDRVRTETTPLNGTAQYCEEIREKDYTLQGLSKHLEVNRIDDDICLSIRYMVTDLKEVEIDLNKRISNLRKILDQPSVKEESDVHRRTSDLNKALLARWQKLRKKGKTAVKTITR